MAETMTMNRVIHAAVRRDLDRLATALATARDTTRAGDLQRAYAHLHAQLKHHHEQEDRHVFPVLGSLGVDTALITEMDDEHHAMSDALDSTAVLMQRYAGTGSGDETTADLAGTQKNQEVA